MKKYFYFAIALLISMDAYSHGEAKPGPNNGFIRMPGAFHTEVVPDKKDNSYHIYLLDLEFKNPTIKNSKVSAVVNQNSKKTTFECKVMGTNHFHCKPEKTYDNKSGQLVLTAKRDKAEGTATYDLPLKWDNDESKKNSDNDSGSDSHHMNH